MNIGKKIRTLRLSLNYTQQELARQLGLTKGYISQVENNLTSPSLQTLFSILEALGSNPNQFFSQEEEQIIIYKKEVYQSTKDDILKHVMTNLIPSTVKFNIDPKLVEIEAGGQTPIEDGQPGEEFGYVLEGQITVVFNQKRYIIRKGESFFYTANKTHYMMNPSNAVAKVLWISSPVKQ